MLELSSIKDTVMKVADAITAAIGIETEIVDSNLKIIGGTGRYVKKIGSYEEDGDLESGYIYGIVLKTGREYICLDVDSDKLYDPLEGELAEISCPIQIEHQIIGIIGLVAFTEDQKKRISENHENLLDFLRRMSELIASKLIESQSESRLAVLLESMPEGLIAVDDDGYAFSCNFTGEILLKRKRAQVVGKHLSSIFPGNDLLEELDENSSSYEKDVVYINGEYSKHFKFTLVPIPDVGTMLLFKDFDDATKNAGEIIHLQSKTSFDEIIGESEQMLRAKQRAMQVAGNDSTILITGESGTGKELFARAIHSSGNRSENMFIAINCAAIPESLLESELFGYEAGAFTGAGKEGKPGKFELANKGTVFLDEIGDMPLHLQAKLLRVLQNKSIERVGGVSSVHIDVRIISATNKDLEDMMLKKEFREDLYFRLNVIPLHISPLRERPADVELLLAKSLNKSNKSLGKQVSGFDKDALIALKSYFWPGNVRELENAVEFSVNMESGSLIRYENLPDRIKDRSDDKSYGDGKTLKEQSDIAMKRIIESCLDETGDDLAGKRKAAYILDISESTLYRKLRELNISR